MNRIQKIERIEHIFQFMEWDNLTGSELNLIESFEKQFKAYNSLSDRQLEVLEDIFKKANER